MHPSIHAKSVPDKPALIIEPGGETISYAALEANSNRVAHFLRGAGLAIGDTVAICMDNRARYFDVIWGAQRSGLIAVSISSRLTAPEIAYILEDSGARLLIASEYIGDAALDRIAADRPDVARYLVGAARGGWHDLDQALAGQPDTPIADERAGTDMLYSSGTTGKPKGIRLQLPENSDILDPGSLTQLAQAAFGFGSQSVYMSPAPLYHAAPLRWCMAVHRLGGTVICMAKFDPEEALHLIQKYRANAGQWVPTHFVRMLKLPEAVRAAYDVSSVACAVHAAAPCPVPIKQAMIDWWGPVLKEYYAGTEGHGFTFIDSQQWLAHKGSVGRPLLGILHICDEAGKEVPPRTEGTVYFENETLFTYHNDPAKTAESRSPQGWATIGDVGWVDEEGYLYLTDRKSFMIISGGVNVYPQEIENLLIAHEEVADAAVIGAPDDDLGERVVAVVQPLDPGAGEDALRARLSAYLRGQLSGAKLPRQIDFREALPRHATGKLYKRLLRDEYWGKSDGRII